MIHKLKCEVCNKYFLSMNKNHKACSGCFIKSGLIEIIEEMFDNGEIEGIEEIKIHIEEEKNNT